VIQTLGSRLPKQQGVAYKGGYGSDPSWIMSFLRNDDHRDELGAHLGNFLGNS
jgi:hypothetical protein